MDIRKKVMKLLDKWYPVLGDPRLKARAIFSEISKDDSRSGCSVDEEYLRVLFSFDEGRLRDELNDEGLEKEIIHEVLHTQVWRMGRRLEELGCKQEEVDRLEESLVTSLDRAVWDAYSLGKKEQKS